MWPQEYMGHHNTYGWFQVRCYVNPFKKRQSRQRSSIFFFVCFYRLLKYFRSLSNKQCLILASTFCLYTTLVYTCICYRRERSGSVVECLTRDREASGSSLTGLTALWSLSKTHLSLLSTGLTQEDPSLFNWKIVDGT